MAHLLVTGGAGYVGSHALLALRAAGHTAVVVDDLRAGRAELVGQYPLVRCDVGDADALRRTFAQHGPFAGVLHFAASLSVAESVAQPLLYYRNNAAASACLLDVALAHGVRAFVLSSTCAVYGVPERSPIDESAPIAPISPYGASKAMVERMLEDAESAHGLRWAALRYFNAAGADPELRTGECHDPEIHLIPSALEAAAGLRPQLDLYGSDYPTPDGTCVRDYVHVSDLAEAHALAMQALLDGERIGARNLGSGRGTSNREVVQAVERVTGKRVPVHEAARRAGDPPQLVADCRAASAQLGWRARHCELDTIVATAWAWLRRWRRL